MVQKLRKFKLLTLVLLLLSISPHSIAQISVTATAGTPGPTAYTTLKGAFDAINLGTHQGAINISVTAGTTETATATINASGSGSALYTSVAIKPAASTTPTITGNLSGVPVIRINGASNVTIDGSNTMGGTTRDLTISNTNATTLSQCVAMYSLTTTPIANNALKNTTLINGSQSGNTIAVMVSSSGLAAGYFNNITVQNNSIQKTGYGIYAIATVTGTNGNNTLISGNTLNASGANAIRYIGVYCQGVYGATVSNNTIANFESATAEVDRGIWFATGTTNSTISDNTISALNYSGAAGGSSIGINLTPGVASAAITATNNTISDMAASGTGNMMGLQVAAASSGLTITRNNIHNIRNTNAYGACGMALQSTLTSAAVVVANNFISNIYAYGWNTATISDNGYGIIIAAGGGYGIYHNSINLTTNQTYATSISAAINVTSGVTTGGAIDLRDNIIATNQTAGGNRYAIYSTAANTVFSNINYNDYYTAAGGVLGYIGATNRTTLAQIQAGFGGNLNSLNVQPVFVGAPNLHMVPASNLSLNNVGTPIAGVTVDIDNAARSVTTPDIGADEFTPITEDASVTAVAGVCPGTQNVVVTITNNGISTLNSVDVNWSVNGVAQPMASFGGLGLTAGNSTTVTLGTYTFVANTTYTFYAATTNPNGTIDLNPGNDALNTSITPGLSGTLTVGPGGDFATLTAAVAAYNTAGICGPTVFSLTSANYNAGTGETFPITINSTAGASSTNKLTIRPASGVSPTITSATGAATIKLMGADYVIIDGSNNGSDSRNLTISHTLNGTTASVIWIGSASASNGATNDTIRNCNMSGFSNTTTIGGVLAGSGNTFAGIADVANSGNAVVNNRITKVQNGCFLYGAAAMDQGWLISRNNFGSASVAADKLGFRGLFLGNQQNATVSRDTIVGLTTTTATYILGLQVFGSINGGTISQCVIGDIANTNSLGYGAHGIYLGASTTASNLTIANNFIRDVYAVGYTLGTAYDDNGYGIMMDGGGGYKLYHNTINLGISQTGTGISAAINISAAMVTAASVDLRDNIIATNQAAGGTRYGIYCLAANTIFSNINYNDYYANGGNLGYIGGSARTSLAQMQTGFGGNANSVVAQPVFVSSTDLHLIPASNLALNNVGTPIAGITTDIDGAARSLTTPDIGADEFAPITEDAAVTAVSDVCPGTQNVQVTIYNYGLNVLNTVDVNWSVNGVAQPMASFSGLGITTGNSTTVTLGTYTFAPMTTYTFYAATTNPNGTIDLNTGNDALNTTVTPGLSGTYTVGAGGNFATLTAAAAAYNTSGLCGPVTFSLTNAAYNTGTGETFPIIFSSIPTSSATNTLTIKPAAGVQPTISSSTANHTLKLDGADYVIIDGSNTPGGSSRDLTITNTMGGNSTVVWIGSPSVGNGATNDTVRNCAITGLNNTNVGTTIGIFAGSGFVFGGAAVAANSNNAILNNSFVRMQNGIFVYGVAALDQGWLISRNKIGSTSVAADKMGFRGIFLGNLQNANVSNDTVAGVATTTATYVFGIQVFGSMSGGSIHECHVSDVTNTTPGGFGATGIYLAASTTASNFTVANNFIREVYAVGYASGTAYDDNGYGIMMDGGGGYKLYHNTINLGTSQTGTGISAAINISAAMVTAASVDLRNNIISTSQTAGGTRYGLYCSAANTIFSNIDYNDYYANGGNLGYIGSARTSLAQMQAGFGSNTNSVAAQPVFVSVADLHIKTTDVANMWLNDAATYLAAVPADIDGAGRSVTTPDIGADEFTPNCAPRAWFGKTSDWGTASNWCGGIPTVSDDAVINTAALFMPNITGMTANVHNLSIGSTGTLNMGASSMLNIYGDLTNLGTMNTASGDFAFAGTTPQTAPGFSANAVTMNNTNGLTLGGNMDAASLSFTSGIIDLGANTLTVTGAVGGSYGPTAYVRTSAPGGGLKMPVVQNAPQVTFPVGNTAYNPVRMSNTGTTDFFTASVRNGVLTEGSSGTQIDNTTTYAIDHTWDISEDVAGGSNVTLTLQWNNGEENSGSFDYSHVYISHYGGSSWDNPYPYAFLAPAAGGSGPFTATRSGITSFSPFAIGSAGGSSPLPVTLVRLDASNQGSRNKVEWESATEHDLKSYIVERSTDGKRFDQMNEVTAAGKAQGYITYDNQPAQGFTYYRLKMVDYSGAFVYSQTVKAFMGRAGEVVLTAAPNPLRDVLTVSVYGAQDGQAQLTDVSGRVVASAAMQAGQATFNTSALAAGTYFVKWSNGVASQTVKVTKQ